MRLLFILFIIKISSVNLHGQSLRYEQLMDVIKDKAGLILYHKPPSVRTKLLGLKDYFQIRNPKNQLSDTALNNLIEASNQMDSTNWEQSEFSRTVVVSDRSDIINVHKILKTWGLTDKEEIKKYRKLLNKWTNTDIQIRQLNYLSRPILTDNEEYGVILTDIGAGNLCCGGQITLYKYESGQWKDLGAIFNWRY